MVSRDGVSTGPGLLDYKVALSTALYGSDCYIRVFQAYTVQHKILAGENFDESPLFEILTNVPVQ